MIVADTDVLIDALQGVEPARGTVTRALERGLLATTAVTSFELQAGARYQRDRNAIELLLSAMQVLPLDDEAATSAGATRRALEAAGTPIGMADYLIAGICLAQGASLLTRNVSHFGRVPHLSVTQPSPDEGTT